MKKNLARITAIVSAAFGIMFIILLICTAFGGLSSADFDNKLVKVLLFVFGGCYLGVTIAMVALQFASRVTVREVQVAQMGSGNIKVTPAVIRGLIKKNVKALDGIRFRRMSLILTEFGVQLSLTVSCSLGRRAQETGAFLQALIADVCKRELDLEFHTVNVKVVGFKSIYAPDIARIEAETQAMLGKEPEFPDERPDPEFIEVETPADDANNAPESSDEATAAETEIPVDNSDEGSTEAQTEAELDEPTDEQFDEPTDNSTEERTDEIPTEQTYAEEAEERTDETPDDSAEEAIAADDIDEEKSEEASGEEQSRETSEIESK